MMKLCLALMYVVPSTVVLAQTSTTCPPRPDCGTVLPSTCEYVAPTADANGCITDCGALICQPIDDNCFLGFACDVPPAYCEYGTAEINPDTGCAIGCGKLECKCPPEPVCPALAAGCAYENPVYNANGCWTGCGTVVCKPVCPVCVADPCATKKCGRWSTCKVIAPRRTTPDRNGCFLCSRAQCVLNRRRGLRSHHLSE
jgi:hypothetical protein